MAWLQCRSRASGPSYGAGGHKKLAQQAPHLPTPAKRLAQREAMCAISAKRLSQHAIKRPFWAILPALGKYFRAIAIDSRRWANFVAPTLLTAPQDETVDTNAETPGRPHETHDAFARENCAENRCIWLAMVSSVSPETKHTPAKAMAVSRELPAHRRATAVCCGGHRRDRRAWLRCPWAVAGPGRASRRRAKPHISNQAPLLWREPEGPEGTGGLRDRPLRALRLACGDLAGSRALRRPEHQRRHKQPTRQPTQRKRAAAQRAAARSRSQWSTQRRRAATTSATWTAFRAAPLRRLSPETTRTRPRLPSTAWS